MTARTTWKPTPVSVPPATDEVQTEDFVLSDTSVAPAQTGTGLIPLGIDLDPDPTGIEFILVNGRYQGPTMLFQAGVHGDEYDAQQAIRLLIAETDPEQLHGRIIAIPCVNNEAFRAGIRANGVDQANFNRMFPGSSTGTFSYKLADLYAKTLIPAADGMLDLHTGGGYGQITPLAVVQQGYEELAEPLGMAACNKVLWKGGAWDGTSRHGFLKAGKPAVTLEAGGGSYKQEYVQHHLGCLRSVLRHLGMVEGEATYLDTYLRVDATFASASGGGFYIAEAEPGDLAQVGDRLAQIVGHLGDVRDEVIAPEDGIVVWIRRRCSTHIGDETIIFGRIDEEITVEA